MFDFQVESEEQLWSLNLLEGGSKFSAEKVDEGVCWIFVIFRSEKLKEGSSG